MKKLKVGSKFITPDGGIYQLMAIDPNAENCYYQITVKRLSVDGYAEGSIMYNEIEWLIQRGFSV